jgi:hypothetical protein
MQEAPIPYAADARRNEDLARVPRATNIKDININNVVWYVQTTG